jgi:site-specific DNA-methyltransferase (adenine-specific)
MIEDAGFNLADTVMWTFGSGFPKHKSLLKPAYEPICLAAKPGKRWLNVDGCRVGLRASNESGWASTGSKASANRALSGANTDRNPKDESGIGRWPANLIHDGSDEVVGLFPQTKSPGAFPKEVNRKDRGGEFCQRFSNDSREQRITLNETGSAARFFYCAKASKADRDKGLETPPKQAQSTRWSRDGMPYRQDGTQRKTPMSRNHHPTVKPTDLMRYLCRLVTPLGGTVLDPFMGSGSTGKAARLEDLAFIGIEREPEYFDIACRRIEDAQRQRSLFDPPEAA